MGKKIFVSYKFSDTKVKSLPNVWFEPTTPRHYLNEFERLIENNDDDIYKGESDGEDLSYLTEESIAKKLKDRIYDSSVTVVFISPGMKEDYKSERKQWIPWEISYSLKEISRGGRTSATNAILAVVIPDHNGLYNYYTEYDGIERSNLIRTNILFSILGKNMFNIKNPKTTISNGKKYFHGQVSYIESVKWVDFIKDYKNYIKMAVRIADRKEDYTIVKELE